MTDALQAAKLKAEKTYNTAADCFDARPLAFWERYGRSTIERLELAHGAAVLDVCCGTGPRRCQPRKRWALTAA